MGKKNIHLAQTRCIRNFDYCMAEGGVFIGRVLKFSSEETDLFPHYRKSFCMAASGVNDCSLNYWLRLPI